MTATSVTAKARTYTRVAPSVFGWILLTVIYFAAGIMLLGNAAANPFRLIPGWEGDNFYFLWQYIWIREAILSGQSPLLVPHIFYPEGFALARDDMTLLNSIPGAIIGGVIGDVLTYNLILVAGSVLSGFCMFFWTRRLTGSAPVAAVAGLAFILLPYRAIRMAGHFDLVTTWPLPLTLLLIDRALETDSLKRWSLVGLGYALAALGAWYFAPALLLTLPIYGLIRGTNWRSVARWKGVTVAALSAGLLLGPAAIPYFMVAGPGTLRHPVTEAMKASASPMDYVIPSVLHPVFGSIGRWYFSASEFGAIDRAVAPGVTILILAGLGVIVSRHRSVFAVSGLAAIAYVLTLGPILQRLGQPVGITWPEPVTAWVLTQEGSLADYLGPVMRSRIEAGIGFIPLPAFFANMLLPLGSALRSWSRLGILVDIAFIGLAAFGLSWLAKKWRLVVPVVGVLVLFELSVTGLPASLVEARPVDRWLRANDDGAPVMFFPIPAAVEPREVYATLDHRRVIVNGHATFPPLTFRRARGVLNTFPSPESQIVLRGWGVRQIAMLPRAYGPRWPEMQQRLRQEPGLRQLATLENAEVWELRRD